MASKQLGKLRQWAGEVISSRDRTIVTDEFRELEHDIELRRQGLWRLHVASEDYHDALRKKKVSDVIEDSDKMLPIDALGIVMIKHGEEFGADSAFGTSLVNLGRTHCKIATLQETYAMLFEEKYFASIRRAEDEIKEYQMVRKKLESRRLSYDAAITKLEKVRNSKKDKEKERAEVEDECARAQSRYEETAEDVRARMHAIQENEVEQLRELSSLLDIEMNYAEQCLEVLRDVKANWVDESAVQRVEPYANTGPAHTFAHAPTNEYRSNSVRSVKSLSKHAAESSDESIDEEHAKGIMRSLSRRKSQASSKAPSRPQSRASRKRSDSTATAASQKDLERAEKDKEKEKEKAEKASRRMSVAGWASSAMSSVTGLGKKDKDKDSFAALYDSSENREDEEERVEVKRSQSMYTRSKSAPPTPSLSPKVSTRIPASQSMQPSSKWNAAPRKVAVALYDFAASSSDELTFRQGDQIVVVNEVLDGWWMGELGGKRGLFPTTYTGLINPPTLSVPSKPALPQRPPAMSRFGGSNTPSTLSLDGDDPKRKTAHSERDESISVASDMDEEHPFGDHYYAASSSPLYGHEGASSGGEDNDEERLMPVRRSKDYDEDRWQPSTPPRAPDVAAPAKVPAKKPPPPPPPRRAVNATPPVIPPLPSRPATIRSRSSQSSSASLVALATTPTMDRLTHSPFDSPRDFQ